MAKKAIDQSTIQMNLNLATVQLCTVKKEIGGFCYEIFRLGFCF